MQKGDGYMEEPIFNREGYSELHWSKEEKEHEKEASVEFEKKKRKELLKMEKRKRDNELYAIQMENPKMKNNKPMTTTKLIMYVILINCIVVEIYSMWIMYTLQDLSALYSLIGAVIGESISFAVYCAKSFKETKEEALIALERDKFNANLSINNDEFDEEIDDDELFTEDANEKGL